MMLHVHHKTDSGRVILWLGPGPTDAPVSGNPIPNFPNLDISEQEAKALADRLYAEGIRPAEAAGLAENLNQCLKRIDDLRSFVQFQRSLIDALTRALGVLAESIARTTR